MDTLIESITAAEVQKKRTVTVMIEPTDVPLNNVLPDPNAHTVIFTPSWDESKFRKTDSHIIMHSVNVQSALLNVTAAPNVTHAVFIGCARRILAFCPEITRRLFLAKPSLCITYYAKRGDDGGDFTPHLRALHNRCTDTAADQAAIAASPPIVLTVQM